MTKLTGTLPPDFNSALAYLASVTQPTIDDLRLMVVVEASGECLYQELADSVDDGRIKDVLVQNGREEMAHAHRVAKAVQHLTREACAVPEHAQNPYCGRPEKRVFTAATCASMIAGEIGGEDLYTVWANSLTNPAAAELLRQNGAEERRHGERLQTIAHLL